MIGSSVINGDVEKYVKDMAENIFYKNTLRINNFEYIFTELEFYFYSNYHKDEYSHIKDIKINNYTTGDFRFHYSGVDLVICKKDEFFCGVLMRGIQNCETHKCINGPLRVLVAICNDFNNLYTSEPLANSTPPK